MFNKKNNIEPVIETTSFLLKNIDADLWRKFKVKAIMDNSNMTATLKKLIYKYVSGEIND
tara:strand:+ start:125 stop:304 length:180 start_codon:yes stop_codon:yes gene_type:complete